MTGSARTEDIYRASVFVAHLVLPGEFTKNGEAARLLLIPSFATELAAWITATSV